MTSIKCSVDLIEVTSKAYMCTDTMARNKILTRVEDKQQECPLFDTRVQHVDLDLHIPVSTVRLPHYNYYLHSPLSQPTDLFIMTPISSHVLTLFSYGKIQTKINPKVQPRLAPRGRPIQPCRPRGETLHRGLPRAPKGTATSRPRPMPEV
ncbi:hypothetical protein RRG08_031417 [Elysia crispata]|uniref:Uncharacterized protein n=1 Tax=Elysia crispata TaxID=231223 RepID=A0AAE1DK62_9GAST|nr:hypothetical protein RRG08_031417 [Elysia crispata]